MIRFELEPKALLDLVDAAAPGWRHRAALKQKDINKAKRVDQGEGIWSEIKQVYMELQGYKCMYCEKPMPRSAPKPPAGAAQGKGEYDVEHFRPKNSVKPWPTAAVKALRRIDYEASLKKPPAGGYYRLAHDPFNYGVSCKTCNSELKGDRFPTLAKPSRATTNRALLDQKEQPCLLLPIGETAADPELLLEWLGPIVRSRNAAIRGRVIVDFFQLDSRADLIDGRAALVVLLFPKLEARAGTGAAAKKAKEFVAAMTEPTSTWSACARAYAALHEADQPEAERWNDLCEQYLARKDPAIFGP